MDETMVERVARAIMVNRVGGACLVKDWRREEVDNVHVAQALAQARAAIEAMRDPPFDPDSVSYHGTMTRRDWWNAMIDAALAKGDER